MKISCIQLNIEWENQLKNYNRIKTLINKACEENVDLICLPELFSTGVTLNSSKFEETTEGNTCKFLAEQAKKHKVYLLGSFIEKSEDKLPMNTVIIFDPKGKIIAKYNKNHIFTYNKEDTAYSKGKSITTFKIKEFTIAPFICYDLRFPELFRIALGKDVNLFIIPANWPRPRQEHWRTLLKARAIENQAYVIGLNRCGDSSDLSFFGGSLIFSPLGEIIGELGTKEEILTADLEISDVSELRETFGSIRDRRIKYYKQLESE